MHQPVQGLYIQTEDGRRRMEKTNEKQNTICEKVHVEQGEGEEGDEAERKQLNGTPNNHS